MIEALLKRQDSVDMYIMYDIACILHKHLEVIFDEFCIRIPSLFKLKCRIMPIFYMIT